MAGERMKTVGRLESLEDSTWHVQTVSEATWKDVFRASEASERALAESGAVFHVYALLCLAVSMHAQEDLDNLRGDVRGKHQTGCLGKRPSRGSLDSRSWSCESRSPRQRWQGASRAIYSTTIIIASILFGVVAVGFPKKISCSLS